MIKRSPATAATTSTSTSNITSTSTATATATKVTFALPVDVADQPISVVGEFNGWDPFAHPLKRRSNGTRSVSVELEPARSYRFKYLAADGSWLTDPDAESVDNGHGDVDSVVSV
jgi:1,4-alpha-glucan branching enzyme